MFFTVNGPLIASKQHTIAQHRSLTAGYKSISITSDHSNYTARDQDSRPNETSLECLPARIRPRIKIREILENHVPSTVQRECRLGRPVPAFLYGKIELFRYPLMVHYSQNYVSRVERLSTFVEPNPLRFLQDPCPECRPHFSLCSLRKWSGQHFVIVPLFRDAF